jgi:NADH:ubiquinone oxidoreductase subunit F (NADH-binding)
MLGEETVLLKALEGKRGQPDQRPPHPAETGLFDRPTVVNNVQTLAAVPWIVREGADAFRATGSTRAPGTVLVQVRTPGKDGVAEVPLGTPLRDILKLGGRLPEGRSLQAVLIGGPSGGLLPPDAFDTPYDFDGLRDGRRPSRIRIARPRR